eukprot:2749195-Rhodomonas_salina.4
MSLSRADDGDNIMVVNEGSVSVLCVLKHAVCATTPTRPLQIQAFSNVLQNDPKSIQQSNLAKAWRAPHQSSLGSIRIRIRIRIKLSIRIGLVIAASIARCYARTVVADVDRIFLLLELALSLRPAPITLPNTVSTPRLQQPHFPLGPPKHTLNKPLLQANFPALLHPEPFLSPIPPLTLIAPSCC